MKADATENVDAMSLSTWLCELDIWVWHSFSYKSSLLESDLDYDHRHLNHYAGIPVGTVHALSTLWQSYQRKNLKMVLVPCMALSCKNISICAGKSQKPKLWPSLASENCANFAHAPCGTVWKGTSSR
eukprot:6254624-Amphidinium_carterae.1